eukprot:601629_1
MFSSINATTNVTHRQSMHESLIHHTNTTPFIHQYRVNNTPCIASSCRFICGCALLTTYCVVFISCNYCLIQNPKRTYIADHVSCHIFPTLIVFRTMVLRV